MAGYTGQDILPHPVCLSDGNYIMEMDSTLGSGLGPGRQFPPCLAEVSSDVLSCQQPFD